MRFPDVRARSVLLVVGLWSVPACVGALGRWLEWRRGVLPGPAWAQIVAGALPWYTWLVLTPLVLRAARRHPLVRPLRAGRVARHAVASVLVGHAYMSVGMAWLWWNTGTPFTRSYAQFLPFILPLGLIGYWGLVLAASWLHADRELSERSLAAARAETQLSRARLDALQAQVHPHFLFNTLNSISALVRRRDDERAVTMIARLAALLRRTLAADTQHEIPLAVELDLTRDYLAIELERLGERLRTEIDAPPELLEARVPNLLLQPLVENAIVHGVAPVETPALVRVVARRAGDRLVLRVENGGASFDAGAAATARGHDVGRRGLGLANVRARLRQIHGEDARLDLAPRPGGGCTAEVRLPLRLPPAPPRGATARAAAIASAVTEAGT